MQLGFYFDQTRCTGCFTCIVACKDWNDVPAGPASWMRVLTVEKGKYPDLFVAFLATACYHCAAPACVDACPVNAITKRAADGVVVVDPAACLGKDNCELCLQACPYSAPQFGAEANAKMQKCNFCLDRLAEGKKPACVDACPMRAMDAGPIEELRTKYGNIAEATGFAFSEKLMPAVVFKPSQDAGNLVPSRTLIAPESARH
ncbi:MAG: 4Fe-4S dicluster domain-containing protein [Chloroflexota bacterium]|nr:4Fe-4S dicluster domain-containing protein [Chloroflexota bacterium]